jgi:mRNA-degrading endonuclease toxin of MazEF toxin-antitoxin module
MNKDFFNWAGIKDDANKRSKSLFFKEREVCWVKLGLNIGDEQDGKGDLYLRPILVVKKFNSRIFWGVPLSSKIKENNSFYLKIKFKDKEQSAIIPQMRLLDAKRLVRIYGKLPEKEYGRVLSHTLKYLTPNIVEGQ